MSTLTDEVSEGTSAVGGGNNPNGGRVTYRDVVDMLLRIEKEFKSSQERIETKIDTYILAHISQHSTEQDKLNEHYKTSVVMGERGKSISEEITTLRSEVAILKQWKSELNGMASLVRFAVGTSIIGAIVSLLAIIETIERLQ